MNAENTRTPTARETAPAAAIPARPSSRGTRGGYGRSSGYADGLRRYTDSRAAERFRIH